MTEQQLAAMRQALEFLQDNQRYIADNERHVYVMEYNGFIEKLESIIEQAEKARNQMDEQLDELQKEKYTPQEGRNWSLLEATQASLREHMAEVSRLRAMLAIQPSPTSEGFSACDMATAAAQGFRDGEAAAKREWVGLTDEEVANAWLVADGEHNASAVVKRRITGAIAAKLRERNGAKP